VIIAHNNAIILSKEVAFYKYGFAIFVAVIVIHPLRIEIPAVLVHLVGK
jgi:hypothetical protein